MSRPHVLLIDDDPALLQLLSQYLEQAGYRASTAADGKAGLRALYDGRPDLLILDVMMPELDGWQVCSRVREMSAVPIILLTAKREEVDKLKGFRLGVDDYVTKPFSFAELAARDDSMTPFEFALYKRAYTHFAHCAHKGREAGVIYVCASPKTCAQRITTRFRAEESGVSLERLRQLHDEHERVIGDTTFRVWQCRERLTFNMDELGVDDETTRMCAREVYEFIKRTDGSSGDV